MELQANPDANHLQLYVWILVPLVIILVGVVVWFINKIADKIIEAFNSMIDAVDKLDKSFASFKAEFAAVKAKVDIESPTTKTRLNSHSKEIRSIDKRVGRIETSHNILHPKCKLPTEKSNNYERDYEEDSQVYPEV